MLRVLTYNVHRWLGTDRQTSPARIAEVIAACRPDVAALQEVRVGRTKAGVDQLAAVADALGMTAHFLPTVTFGPERFGLAVLAGEYRDRLATAHDPTPYLEALRDVQAAAEALVRNPNELLLLQALVVGLPPI